MITIAYVKIDDKEPAERALKRFKRLVEKEGILKEWRSRERFEKPSVIKNRKRKIARKKMIRKMHKIQQKLTSLT